MIELVITTLSVIGWFVSIYIHPRISDCMTDGQSPATAIDEAPATFAHPPEDVIFVVSDSAVIMISGRERKASRSSDDLSELGLPHAVCVGPEDAALVRGFSTLVLSDSTADMTSSNTERDAQ